MTRRREALSFGAALALSLALHGSLALVFPRTLSRRTPGTSDVVVVALAPVPEPVQQATANAEAPPSREPLATRDPGRSAPEEAAPEEAAPMARTAPADPPASAPQSAPANTPSPPIPPPRPAAALGSAHRTDAPPAPPSIEARPAPTLSAAPAGRPSPSLRELMPARRDLAGLRSPPPLPDPAAEGATEAVLGLGETDQRYRGYRQEVEHAIYGAWRVGKALVVAGGNRTVLVRFTIDDAGLARDARVVESSGNPTLDAEAVEAVRRARIPPFPTDWTLRRLTLMAQFDYVFR